MGKWHLPFWLGALCFLTACGSGTLPPEESPTTEATPSATPEETQDSGDSLPPTESLAESPPEVEPDAASTATSAALEDTIVIPGEQVGPVTRETSRADLVDLFGEAALQDTEIPVGEGFTESGTTVNADSEQAFSVIWVDESQTRPATVKDFGTAWQIPEGLKVGTPFADLQATLGTFNLYGFAWDYEGTVVLEGSDLAQYYGLLILRLRPDPAAIEASPEAYQAVVGDKLISSDDPNLPPLNLAVYEMIVYLNPPVQ